MTFTITEIKKRLRHLIATNNALLHDLDVSRRALAEMGRERDALRGQVDELRAEIERTSFSGSDGEQTRAEAQLQQRLAREHLRAERLEREREMLLRDAVARREQAQTSEEQTRSLRARLEEAERKRDDIKCELDEATEAFETIRLHLSDDLGLAPEEHPF